MKKFLKLITVAVCILNMFLFSAIIYYDLNLSDSYYILPGNNLSFNTAVPVTAIKKKSGSVSAGKNLNNTETYSVDLKLFGCIPVTSAEVTTVESNEVLVSGETFGIKLYTRGIIVVGTTDVDTHEGLINPSVNAGIKKGDIVLAVNSKTVSSNNDILDAVKNSNGQSIVLTIERNEKQFDVSIKPEKSYIDGEYKLGLWVRDSSAGIGTLTFYDPHTGMLAGLGHSICDSDTGITMPLDRGELVSADVVGIEKSSDGTAGELKGIFCGGKIGDLESNDITGVYGHSCCETITGTKMSVLLKQDISTGDAQILVDIDNNGPKPYSCKIEKIHLNDSGRTQNMVISINDDTLLEKCGGIVQGMSGSPIIQNGKLVGAVTHVFLNNPTKGYAIFAENMIETEQNLAEMKINKAS